MSRTIRHHQRAVDPEYVARGAYLCTVGSVTVASFCGDKRSYANRNLARRAAKTITQANGRLALAYHCPHCAHYHLTTHAQSG